MTITQAIEESIEKWEAICFKGERYILWICSLCKYSNFRCNACPISKATGKQSCRGTSFYMTSDCNLRYKIGCDADYHMLLTLYMLACINPNFEE